MRAVFFRRVTVFTGAAVHPQQEALRFRWEPRLFARAVINLGRRMECLGNGHLWTRGYHDDVCTNCGAED